MKFTPKFVAHIAQLANLQINEQQEIELAQSFDDSLAYVEELSKIDTANIEPTYQVNNLVNVTRTDQVNEITQFSQEQALSNAHQTHNGYFVVPRIIDHEA